MIWRDLVEPPRWGFSRGGFFILRSIYLGDVGISAAVLLGWGWIIGAGDLRPDKKKAKPPMQAKRQAEIQRVGKKLLGMTYDGNRAAPAVKKKAEPGE